MIKWLHKNMEKNDFIQVLIDDLYPVYTEQNYPDRDLDSNLD